MIRVNKNWGFELWIVNKPAYCGKLLHFIKGKKCSWHKHIEKDETFYVHSGKLQVKYGYSENIEDAHEIILEAGDNFYVPPTLVHQIIALEDTDMFEFSTMHKEEDSIRIIKGD
ncbi:MAG TPA: cupin domain-containing protein [Agriterribacter sp.]|nr:cupin domain-containing protein [Agriterribacter sp.]